MSPTALAAPVRQTAAMSAPFAPELPGPIETRMLVAFADTTRYMVTTRGRPPLEVFAELEELYRLTETAIAEAGGLVLKFIGDGILIVFSEEAADEGIVGLLGL